MKVTKSFCAAAVMSSVLSPASTGPAHPSQPAYELQARAVLKQSTASLCQQCRVGGAAASLPEAIELQAGAGAVSRQSRPSISATDRSRGLLWGA